MYLFTIYYPESWQCNNKGVCHFYKPRRLCPPNYLLNILYIFQSDLWERGKKLIFCKAPEYLWDHLTAGLLLKSTVSKMNKQTGKVSAPEKLCGSEIPSFGLFEILNGVEMTAEIVVGGEEQVFKLGNWIISLLRLIIHRDRSHKSFVTWEPQKPRSIQFGLTSLVNDERRRKNCLLFPCVDVIYCKYCYILQSNS